MGTSGVPWNASKEAIIDILKKRCGVVSLAAKDLGVHRHTLAKRIEEEPDLHELLAELRNNLVEQNLDTAEEVIRFAMNNGAEDMHNALKSAFFVLNNLGKLRGYSHLKNVQKEMEEMERRDRLQTIHMEIRMESEVQKRVAAELLKRTQEESRESNI